MLKLQQFPVRICTAEHLQGIETVPPKDCDVTGRSHVMSNAPIRIVEGIVYRTQSRDDQCANQDRWGECLPGAVTWWSVDQSGSLRGSLRLNILWRHRIESRDEMDQPDRWLGHFDWIYRFFCWIIDFISLLVVDLLFYLTNLIIDWF